MMMVKEKTCFSTMKEESDRSWNEYDMCKTRYGSIGGEKVLLENAEHINIYDFVPTTHCNLFHGDQIAKILHHLREPYACLWLGNEGRDRFCQFKMINYESAYFEVYASGYGMGESIVFSEGFHEELKFKICRYMSLENIDWNINYLKSCEEDNNNTLKVRLPEQITNPGKDSLLIKAYDKVRKNVYGNVRNYEELKKATEEFAKEYYKIYNGPVEEGD